MRVLGCSEMTAKTANPEVAEGTTSLRVVDYLDPVQRKPRKGLCAPRQNRPGTTEKFT